MKNKYFIVFFALATIALLLGSGCTQKNQVCGNGICEQTEDTKTCQADCQGTNLIKEEVKIGDRRLIFARNPSESPQPAIIALHGRMQSADAWFGGFAQARFSQKALDKGYAVIAPDSIEPICPNVKNWDYRENSTDTEFFNKLIEWIKNKKELDSDKVFVAGISNGAFMASGLAQNIGAPKIKAVAIASGGNPENTDISAANNCRTEFNYNPPKISANHPKALIIHGTLDPIVPFKLGELNAQAIKDAGIESRFLVKQNGSHLWFSEFDDEILEWFGEKCHAKKKKTHKKNCA